MGYTCFPPPKKEGHGPLTSTYENLNPPTQDSAFFPKKNGTVEPQSSLLIDKHRKISST